MVFFERGFVFVKWPDLIVRFGLGHAATLRQAQGDMLPFDYAQGKLAFRLCRDRQGGTQILKLKMTRLMQRHFLYNYLLENKITIQSI